jgi:hypothetical protein
MAGIAVFAGTGVNAVAITEATQVVVPPRKSETVTRPSGPEIVFAVFDVPSDPSDTLAVGALIVRAPPVTVKVVGVAAPAGAAVPSPAARAAKVPPTSRYFGVFSRRVDLLSGFMGSVLLGGRVRPSHLWG